MPVPVYRISAVFLLAACALAQDDVDACAASPDLLAVYFKAKTASDPLPILREALAAHPGSLFTNRWILTARGVSPGSMAADYKTKLDAHPGEPLYLFLYAQSLIGSDTPGAIDLLNQALAKDPHLVQAHDALLDIYSSMNFADSARLTGSLKAYVAQCPANVDIYRYVSYVQDTATMRELTGTFRKAMEERNTIGVVSRYPTLWDLESRLAGSRFAADSGRIRKDLDRIRQLDPDDSDQSISLIRGYRLIGDESAAAALEVRKSPGRAFSAESTAWFASHGGQPAAAASDIFPAATEQWVQKYPLEPEAWTWRVMALAADRRASPQQLESAGSGLLAAALHKPLRGQMAPYSLVVAQFWVARDIRLQDCARLAKEARAEMDRAPVVDDRTSRSNSTEPNFTYSRTQAYSVEIEADRKLRDFAGAHASLAEMKSWLDRNPKFSAGPRNAYEQAAAKLAASEK